VPHTLHHFSFTLCIFSFGSSFAYSSVFSARCISFRSRPREKALQREALSHLKDHSSLYRHISGWAEKRAGAKYVFLDEIQEVESWELCVRSLTKDLGADVYITGSNAGLMSGDLATHMAGRYVKFLIQPLSFEEYYSAEANSRVQREEAFRRYLVSGGMPFLLSLGSGSSSAGAYLKDVYDSVVLRDVVRRGGGEYATRRLWSACCAMS
jgi:predicted AAA+ superfamily ATPase